MFVPFNAISEESRIWIFQADRRMTASELEIVKGKLHEFTNKWAAHGEPLRTSYTIEFNQFIILAADEQHHSPSGCSIDSSVHVLKEIEQLIRLQLFDRNQVAFKRGEEITLIPLQNLKEKFASGTLNEESLSFNNLVGTKSELKDQWIQPAGQTWLKRYIPAQTIKEK